ncbi:chlamydia polymorphic membrane middle domain protein, partial [Chlamydia psittaci 02DC16]
RCRR